MNQHPLVIMSWCSDPCRAARLDLKQKSSTLALETAGLKIQDRACITSVLKLLYAELVTVTEVLQYSVGKLSLGDSNILSVKKICEYIIQLSLFGLVDLREKGFTFISFVSSCFEEKNLMSLMVSTSPITLDSITLC